MIRVSFTSVVRIPHAIANGIHAVAPRFRSRYTVHAVAVSIMGTGFHMESSHHEAIHWFAEHAPRAIAGLVDFGWEPIAELLKGVGIAPYLDGAVAHTLKKIAPEDSGKE